MEPWEHKKVGCGEKEKSLMVSPQEGQLLIA